MMAHVNKGDIQGWWSSKRKRMWAHCSMDSPGEPRLFSGRKVTFYYVKATVAWCFS